MSVRVASQMNSRRVRRTLLRRCIMLLLLVTLPFRAVLATPDETVTQVDRAELAPEALDFIRGIVILLMPPEFADDDGWGDESRIQSGLKVDFENGQLKTRRRWKSVNHGSWLQASGKLVDPETTFQLKAARLNPATPPMIDDATRDPHKGPQRYEVRVAARMRVTGRQQQWSYGLMLWSISADAVVDVSLHVVCEVKTELVKTDEGTRLRFVPNVTHAVAKLDSFDLRRISHAKGSAVQEFGNGLEKLIRLYLDRENEDLAEKINKALHKKPERLEIPFEIGGWFLPPDETAGSAAVSQPKSVQSSPQD